MAHRRSLILWMGLGMFGLALKPDVSAEPPDDLVVGVTSRGYAEWEGEVQKFCKMAASDKHGGFCMIGPHKSDGSVILMAQSWRAPIIIRESGPALAPLITASGMQFPGIDPFFTELEKLLKTSAGPGDIFCMEAAAAPPARPEPLLVLGIRKSRGHPCGRALFFRPSRGTVSVDLAAVEAPALMEPLAVGVAAILHVELSTPPNLIAIGREGVVLRRGADIVLLGLDGVERRRCPEASLVGEPPAWMTKMAAIPVLTPPPESPLALVLAGMACCSPGLWRDQFRYYSDPEIWTFKN